MAVAASTLIHDVTTVVRALVASGTTDPLGANRGASTPFVMSAFPQRNVQYPVVIVNAHRASSEPLGVYSSGTLDTLSCSADVWARNAKERDTISDNVFQSLRTSQHDVNASRGSGTLTYALWDFRLLSEQLLDEPGPESLHRKILTFEYKFMSL